MTTNRIYRMGLLGLLVGASALAHAKQPGATLENDHLSLGFDNKALSLVSLKDPRTGHEFLESLPKSPFLWVLDLEKPDGSKFQMRSSMVGRRQLKRAGDTYTLTWSELEVAGERSAMKVRVTVHLPKDSDRSYWNIEVENESSSSLITVKFPYLAGISKAGQPSAAIPRHNWGNLEKAITHTRGSYPCDIWPMQFLALLEKDSGLYLAYEDPTATPKYFDLTPGEAFWFTSFAENATIAGNDYSSPGPAAIGVSGPDWWKAAKMYRRWAIQQPWTKRGPLTKASNVPEGAKNIGIWFNLGVIPNEAETQISHINAAEDFFQLPMAAQLYVWHRAAFDTEYPEYFPPKPEFAPLVQALTSRGAFVAPYVNGRLQDLDVSSAKEARPFMVKKKDGETPVEDYQSGAKLAVMCPATTYWQTTMQNVAKEILRLGANAIYFDQIGAAEPYLCYDPSHGHPLGGGSYWVDGYRTMLEGVKALRTSEGTPIFVATENTAESYMDTVDAFLTWTPRNPTEIPLLTAVYSGYSIYFGSNAQVENDTGLGPFAMIVGRDMLWGTQPGWMGIDVTSERGAYLRDVARIRHAKRQFFQFGELVGSLAPNVDPGTTSGRWKNVNRDGAEPSEVTLPAVMSSLWKSPDGLFGLAIANLSGEERTFSYTVKPSDYGISRPEGGGWKLTQTNASGSHDLGLIKQAEWTREEKLQPWEFRFIEVSPQAPPDDAS